MKRLLAYGSIGHVGYVLTGIATGVNSGYASSIIYISIYVIMNIGAFFVPLFLKKMENIKRIFQISLRNFKKTPFISNFTFNNIIFFGWHPAIRGFFAKFYVFTAVLEQKMYALAIIGLLTTVISAFYYLRIIKIIYFDEAS